MKKHRVCTTISAKHWELLKKYIDKHGTQQKVLELALENMEKEQKQNPILSPEEQIWMRFYSEFKLNRVICLIHRDLMMELFRTADYEQLAKMLTKLKLAEYQVTWYYKKPLKECSLKEIMDGIVITSNVLNLFDTIDYLDEGSYYMLKVSHSAGSLNYSKLFKRFVEPLFEAYGAKTQSELSENSLFVKVFKT